MVKERQQPSALQAAVSLLLILLPVTMTVTFCSVRMSRLVVITEKV